MRDSFYILILLFVFFEKCNQITHIADMIFELQAVQA